MGSNEEKKEEEEENDFEERRKGREGRLVGREGENGLV